VTGWRTSLRIAAREARRARGRTAMVLLLIALPVFGLAFAAVTYDMFKLRPAERVDRELGTAEARIHWYGDGPVTQDVGGDRWEEPPRDGPATAHPDQERLLAHLPPGSTATPYAESWMDMRTAAGIGGLEVIGVDAGNPLARGIVTVREGRPPAAADEVGLSARAMKRLGTRLGGTVEDAGRTRTFRVVALVESPANLGELMVRPTIEDTAGTWLVHTPQPMRWADVRRLNAVGMVVRSRSVLLDPPANPEGALVTDEGGAQDELGIAAVVGGLALVEVVLLAGPAFAIGARRRRRDLALVAANGGTPGHLRRIVLADGLVLGLAGAVVGVGGGALAAIAGRPLVEEYLAGTRAGGYRVYPLALLAVAALALLTGVLAALAPAVAAARQDVVAALTGRRGTIRSRRRWVVVGVVLTLAGGGIAAAGALTSRALVILGGLVLAELGLVLVTPALVGLIALAGRSLPLGPRIALRDTARNRAAAAPAISAVMAAVAGCVAVGTFLASENDRQRELYRPGMPLGYASVQLADARDGAPTVEQVSAAVTKSLAVTGVTAIQTVGCPDGAPEDAYCSLRPKLPERLRCPYDEAQLPLPEEQRRQALADPRCAKTGVSYGSMPFQTVVGTGDALVPLADPAVDDVRAASRVLAEGGAVVGDPRMVVDGRVTLEVFGESDQPLRSVTVPGYALRTGIGSGDGAAAGLQRTFLSPAAARATGLRTVPDGFVIATSAVPDQAAQDELRAAVAALPGQPYAMVETGAPVHNAMETIVLALAAIVVALGATFVATGLAAADGRADLATLAAIGAAPGVRRVLTLSQSGVIAGLGSLLGAAAGLAAGLSILAAFNRQSAGMWPAEVPYPLVVPGTVLLLLVSIPVVAMLGAGLLTRARLPIERRVG